MSKKRTPARSNVKAPVQNAKDPKKSTIITICVAVGIVIAAVIVVAILTSATREGITSAEPDWVVGRRKVNNSYLYYKLGVTGDVEGFQRDEEATISFSDKLNRTVTYTPVDEDSAIDEIMYYYSPYLYTDCPENSQANLSISGTVLDITDTVTGELDGKNYCYYTYRIENTPAEEGADPTYGQWLAGFVEVKDDLSAMISVLNKCESQDGFIPDEEMIAAFESALKGFTIDEEKK